MKTQQDIITYRKFIDLLFWRNKNFVKLPFKPNTDSIIKHDIPYGKCILLLMPLVSILFMQVSKGQVQTCKVNFYHADNLFLKTKRNIQIFHSQIFCCISPFLEHGCILFCDLQFYASFIALFSLYANLFPLCGITFH